MIARAGIGVFAALLWTGATGAETPRYRGQPNKDFAYEVHITADLPDKVETFQGRIVYQVKSSAEPLKMSYRGGLTKSTQNKPGAASNSFDPFGPGGFAIRPPLGPFERRVEPFQGLVQAKNEITMNADGEIIAMEGSSQLPYLLGNLSLMPFETLPDGDDATWTVERGVLIREKSDEPSRGFDPFAGDPFAARFRSSKPEKTTTGGRSSTFTRQKEMGSLVSYAKTYRLHSPGDGESVTIEGKGVWIFNRELAMPESLDFKQTLTIEDKNITITLPVTIKYRRLSDQEWTKMEADRLAAEKTRREEQERQTAEAKAKAEAPLTDAERKEALDALGRGGAGLEPGLKMLAGKTPRSDDAIARAIQPHLNHSQKPIKDLAQKALAAFSPEFNRTYGVNLRYRDSSRVTELGPWISFEAPLPVGLIVAANRYGYPEDHYFPAEVVDVGSSGLVKVKYVGGGSATGDRLREDMFYAPASVEQPKLDDKQQAAVQAYRDQVQAQLGASPEEAKRIDELNRAYRDTTKPLPGVGNPLPDGVKLPKFLVVAAQKKDGQWYQAHVSGELPDGRISLRFSGEPFDDKIGRNSVRLPPAEVKSVNTPPIVPESVTVAVRTWADRTGQFTIRAKFAGEANGIVRLVREDGKELSVPATSLSDADQRYVESMRLGAAANPFAQ